MLFSVSHSAFLRTHTNPWLYVKFQKEGQEHINVPNWCLSIAAVAEEYQLDTFLVYF